MNDDHNNGHIVSSFIFIAKCLFKKFMNHRNYLEVSKFNVCAIKMELNSNM